MKDVKIAVSSKNLNKIEGIKEAFSKYFEVKDIQSFEVNSNVSSQPFNEEVKMGAINRTENLIKLCNKNNIEFDYYVSAESGIINFFDEYYNISFCVISDKEKISSGISSAFPIPKNYIEKIKEMGLSHFMDEIYSHDNNSSKGAIRILTKNQVTRIDLTAQSVIMALTKFLNENWN